MPDEAKKSLIEHAAQVAENSFDHSDFASSSSEMSKGLAETHEQISDVYASGTSDGRFIRDDGP